MHHIYCISGLGADQRIFQKLKIENAELHFIHWEMPDADDSMRSYAIKLARQIKHENVILVGVSYGGMLASEINAYQAASANTPAQLPFHVEKTILISSCKHNGEFPAGLKWASRLNIHKAVPYRMILRSNILNRFVFDLRSKEEELYMKRMMLKDNELEFIKRSIRIILKWEKKECGNGLLHIHGNKDRLITPGNIHADYWIRDGGHFMVWNKADEISRIINGLLKDGCK
jgi:pimeloyl-ACP methyl ester carboxylesterase